MPRLAFPTAPGGGLIVDTRVTLGTTAFATAMASGVVPPTIPCRGQIDTGSNTTGISAALLQAIGATPVQSKPTQGIAGTVRVRMYEGTVFVVDAARPHIPGLIPIPFTIRASHSPLIP